METYTKSKVGTREVRSINTGQSVKRKATASPSPFQGKATQQTASKTTAPKRKADTQPASSKKQRTSEVPSGVLNDDLRKKLNKGCVGTGVEIKKSGVKGAGYGLFALRKIKKGEPITGYEGELITQKEAKLRRISHMRTLFSQRYVVDGLYVPHNGKIQGLTPAALRGKGGAVYANDATLSSPVKKTNNAIFVRSLTAQFFSKYDYFVLKRIADELFPIPKYGLNGDAYLYLTATRNIDKGEEIFAEYGSDYNKKSVQNVRSMFADDSDLDQLVMRWTSEKRTKERALSRKIQGERN